MGYNPAWAQTKATTACINIHWEKVYRDVLVLSAVRASGLITGMQVHWLWYTFKLQLCLLYRGLACGTSGYTRLDITLFKKL